MKDLISLAVVIVTITCIHATKKPVEPIREIRSSVKKPKYLEVHSYRPAFVMINDAAPAFTNGIFHQPKRMARHSR
ncbi:MAG: hypothetical protein H7Y27_16590 [Gemmatimonadaceae bacterium]|nr:hypothetical protein [Chitinophagaceae bacterium]